jgi:hypothetical protein
VSVFYLFTRLLIRRKNWELLEHPEDHEVVSVEMERRMNGQTKLVKYEGRNKRGKVIDPNKDAEKPGMELLL